MVQFAYKAKQGPQKLIEGFVEADNIDGAVAKIVQSGLTPIDVHTPAGYTRPRLSLRLAARAAPRTLKVSAAAVSLFTRQISDLLEAGVPVLRTLTILERQTRNSSLKVILGEMAGLIKDGASFSSVLANYPKVFSKLYVNLVKSGEVGGHLNVVFSRLADYLEKDQETRSQIKASLLYPSIILAVGSITIVVLFTWVIPKITMIFEDMNEALPLPTVILMGVSQVFAQFWWVMALAVAAGLIYFQRLRQSPAGKLALDRFKLRVPFVGDLLRDAEIGRFARTLGTLLGNGVVIVAALESVGLVVENEIFKNEVKRMTQEVTNGVSLTSAIRKSDLFPETAVNMIAVAEETGDTHKGLYKLAEYYERQSQRVMKMLTSSIEPALILGMGLVVGFVVLGMLLPILRMNMIIK